MHSLGFGRGPDRPEIVLFQRESMSDAGADVVDQSLELRIGQCMKDRSSRAVTETVL